MGRSSGIGGLIAILALAFLFGRPRERTFISASYFHRTFAPTLPTFPDYPQVTINGARPRIDPTTVDYEEALASKYPDELEATRVSYAATRKVLGLRQYTAPPMPKTSRRR